MISSLSRHHIQPCTRPRTPWMRAHLRDTSGAVGASHKLDVPTSLLVSSTTAALLGHLVLKTAPVGQRIFSCYFGADPLGEWSTETAVRCNPAAVQSCEKGAIVYAAGNVRVEPSTRYSSALPRSPRLFARLSHMLTAACCTGACLSEQ